MSKAHEGTLLDVELAFNKADSQYSGRVKQREAASAFTGKRHQCDHCGKLFRRYACLMTHRRTHTGEKPYKCGICDRAFSIASNLVRHGKMHNSVNLHECKLCGKTFAQYDRFLRHQVSYVHSTEEHAQNQLDELGELSPLPSVYQCELCYKAFCGLQYLIWHRQTHIAGVVLY